MKCSDFVESVTELLEGALPADRHDLLTAHLEDCRGCVNYLRQIRLTRQLAGRLYDDSVEPEVRRRLLSTYRQWRGL